MQSHMRKMKSSGKSDDSNTNDFKREISKRKGFQKIWRTRRHKKGQVDMIIKYCCQLSSNKFKSVESVDAIFLSKISCCILLYSM